MSEAEYGRYRVYGALSVVCEVRAPGRAEAAAIALAEGKWRIPPFFEMELPEVYVSKGTIDTIQQLGGSVIPLKEDVETRAILSIVEELAPEVQRLLHQRLYATRPTYARTLMFEALTCLISALARERSRSL